MFKQHFKLACHILFVKKIIVIIKKKQPLEEFVLEDDLIVLIYRRMVDLMH